MDRQPPGGSDYGPNMRDLGDEPPPAIRDAAPDYLGPVDESAPVSGHVAPPAPRISAADAPEHDWEAARQVIFPLLRPAGTQGLWVEDLVQRGPSIIHAGKSHAQPLVDEGPAGLSIVYLLHVGGFDVIVSGDHVLTWGVKPAQIQDAALRNLAAWSAGVAWTDETSGERHLLSSDSGDGWDATRILLPEIRDHLAGELGGGGRVLVGLPERHLLVAGGLRPGDEGFAALFAEFVLEQSGGADEPVDRRVFELVDGRLVEFSPVVVR